MHTYKFFANRISNTLSIGLFIGFLCGVHSSLLAILNNRYYDYQLYRLLLVTIRNHLNQTMLFFLVIAVVLHIFYIVIKFIFSRLVRSVIKITVLDENRMYFLLKLITGLISFVAIVWILKRFYLFQIFSFNSLVSYIFIAILLMLILNKTDLKSLIEQPHNTTKFLRIISLGLFTIVVAFNLAIYFDHEINCPETPSILLISIDALRFDSLGINGCEINDITPSLDKFARNSINFNNCITQSSWTLPAHMSMLTSLYAQTHKMDTHDASERLIEVDPAVITLAEVLKNARYNTFALTGGGFVDGRYGLSQGFDVYEDERIDLITATARLKKVLSTFHKKPFFIFFHTYEVHAPYMHLTYFSRMKGELNINSEQEQLLKDYIKSSHQSNLNDYRIIEADFGKFLFDNNMFNKNITKSLYLGGVNHMDSCFGDILDHLKELDLLENTIIIFTSDHGEEFGEHNETFFYNAHAHSLYDELLKVPLILFIPGNNNYKNITVSHQVALIDIMPTILDYLNIASPEKMMGINILPYLENTKGTRFIYSETSLHSKSELKSVRTDELKYIKNYSCISKPCGPLEALYNLKNDQAEKMNLIDSDPETKQFLTSHLEEYLQWAPNFLNLKTTISDLSDKQKQQLRALGYAF